MGPEGTRASTGPTTGKDDSRPCFPLTPERCGALPSILEAGWQRALGAKLVLYDPSAADVEVFTESPFRYHHLPQRAMRPGVRRDPTPPPEGIYLAHSPCPFDDKDFVRDREVLRLLRDGRTYHIACNRFPVTAFHFLLVRAAQEPRETLGQYLHAAHDLEDMLFLLAMVGAPYRAYFNCNRGADGSQSGSSINHFHFQLFKLEPDPASPLMGPTQKHDAMEKGSRPGAIPDWPAHHIFFDGAVNDAATLASVLWERVHALNALNVSYNIEAFISPENRFRVFLFPRHPAPPMEVKGVGTLSPNFGGWELSGNIVIPTREILEWIKKHPEEARRLTERRLQEGTRQP